MRAFEFVDHEFVSEEYQHHLVLYAVNTGKALENLEKQVGYDPAHQHNFKDEFGWVYTVCPVGDVPSRVLVKCYHAPMNCLLEFAEFISDICAQGDHITPQIALLQSLSKEIGYLEDELKDLPMIQIDAHQTAAQRQHAAKRTYARSQLTSRLNRVQGSLMTEKAWLADIVTPKLPMIAHAEKILSTLTPKKNEEELGSDTVHFLWEGYDACFFTDPESDDGFDSPMLQAVKELYLANQPK